MTIEKKNYKKGVTLLCSGEFTIYEASEILKDIKSAVAFPDTEKPEEEKPVYLDLSKVTDCDTAGIQILLYIRKMISQMNKKLIIAKSNQTVDELFELLDLNKFFNRSSAT